MVYIKNQEHEASEPAQGVRKGFIGKEMLRLMLDESLWGDELWELHREKRAIQTRDALMMMSVKETNSNPVFLEQAKKH